MAQLALLFGYGLVFWLIRKDMAWRKTGSRALLIPLVWLAVQGSRPLSYWFGGGGGSDANPIDTAAFAILIGASVLVLSRRGLNWGRLVQDNKALFLVYAYFALSAFWSDDLLVSWKRLFKDFGCVLVALVMLTEVNPAEAARTVYVRVAYILFPLSVVFIKFFPDIGRQSTRAGENMFTGVTTQKNSLGETVFVFGLFLLWDWVEIYRDRNQRDRKTQLAVRAGIFLVGLWLLVTCDSQTSRLCLMLGIFVFWGCGRLLRMPNGKSVLIACLAVGISLTVLDKTFGLSEMVIRAMGRNPTLTGRTEIWRLVMDQHTDPLVGMGFYRFWDSDKGRAIRESYMKINSTHNGYLEMYVDGGLVADTLIILLLLTAGKRAINRLFAGEPMGRFSLIFWLIPIIYNLSETSFFRLDPLWLTFMLVTIECPQRLRSSPAITGDSHEPRKNGETDPNPLENLACA
jgi:exopolysaccharide production protein ExoQ